MKQVVRRVIDRKGEIRIEEIPAPAMGEHDVLIDVRFTAISSGTEMATLNKTLPELVKQTLQDPWMRQAVKNVAASGGVLGTADRVHDELIAYRLVGYSGAGVVLDTGAKVGGISPGDTVAFCGHGHAEVVSASRNQVVRIPEGLSLREAAFGTVGAIALQGVRRAGIEIGERVAVIGLGLVGQLACQLAHAAGAHCIGIEPAPARRELAASMGLRDVLDPAAGDPVARVLELTGNLGADRVLICASGTDESIANQALKMARPQGRVTVVGIVPMKLERMPFFRRELDFVFSRAYGPGPFDVDWERGRQQYPIEYVRWDAGRNIQAFLEQTAAGRVQVEPLISTTWAVDEAQAAYAAVYSGSSMASLLEYEPTADAAATPKRLGVERRFPRLPRRSDAIKLGFIGCGNFTRSVLLPEVSKLRGARIHAIAAAGGLNAKPMAEKYGAAYITAQTDEIFADNDLDAVIIATRHHLHADLAAAALRAGKHVLVEKPMALSAEEAIALEALARENQLHLIVGHNRRYAPLTRRLLEARAGSGAAMCHYVVNIAPLPSDHWTLNATEGGGRLLGESDHFFDMLNLFASARPEAVTATAALQADQELHESCNFAVQIRYDNGSAGTLLYTDLGHADFPRERLEVFSGGAVLRLEGYSRAEVIGPNNWKARGRVHMGHREELENFVGVVRGEAEPLGTAQDGLLATLVAQAAWRSLHTGLEMRIGDLGRSEAMP